MALFVKTVARALFRLKLDKPGDASFPRPLRPMVATLGRSPFDDPGWLVEPKWDGFRIMAYIQNGKVRLLSRNLQDFSALFRPIAESLEAIAVRLVLDGEVVALDARGRPDFEALQQRFRPSGGKPAGRLTYMVFDCLHVNGHSLLTRPLEDRQAVLRALRSILHTDVVRVTEPFEGERARTVFNESMRLGIEGIVMKRRGSPYRQGERSRDWLKIPVRQRDEFVVGGYLAPTSDHLSTLIVGQYDRRGKLRYAGLVGTGLSEETRRVILRELQATGRKTSPFVPVPILRDHFGELRTDLPPRWVKPTLVVEVEYRQRMEDGLRHAALKALRPDKNVREVRAKKEARNRR